MRVSRDITGRLAIAPAVAAAHQRLLGTGDPVVVGQWLRLTAAVLFIGYAVAMFALARRFVPPRFAFLATLLARSFPGAIDNPIFSPAVLDDANINSVARGFADLLAAGPPRWG